MNIWRLMMANLAYKYIEIRFPANKTYYMDKYGTQYFFFGFTGQTLKCTVCMKQNIKIIIKF